MGRRRGGCRHNGYHGRPDGGVYGLLAMILMGIFVLPIIGLYFLLTAEDSDRKTLGAVLLGVGIVIWIACGINSMG